ncbi:YciI family protein [Phytohabitans houttuyneae]|uniref:YCII-related domain-containing protein n=2 Tax=Phytohabitans houttuyneae TaxID=1076126 RepID=A0A6V8KAN4_9ACTN|nr:hypothetical protein Phou_029370 [Phytohabitans houttuyneae]
MKAGVVDLAGDVLVVRVGGPLRAGHEMDFDMAKYLILIYGDAQRWDAMTAEDRKELEAGHASFSKAAGSRVLAGHELELAPMATTLRTDGVGGVTTTDGPFLEAKEAVGGYYLMEAADLDEVMGLAALLPEVHADHSGVEIRPIVDHG